MLFLGCKVQIYFNLNLLEEFLRATCRKDASPIGKKDGWACTTTFMHDMTLMHKPNACIYFYLVLYFSSRSIMVHQSQFLKNCVHFSILWSLYRSCKPLYIM